MNTIFVMLLLASAVSARDWNLGVNLGVRDYDDSSERRVRATPQLMLTFGSAITPESPVRLDVVAGGWTVERETPVYSWGGFWGPRVVSTRNVDHPGYFLGGRVQIDAHPINEFGRRMARPTFGLGYQWQTEKALYRLETPWYEEWDAEAVLGLAVPFVNGSDLLFQYSVMGQLEIEHGKFVRGDNSDCFSLGYRFNAFE